MPRDAGSAHLPRTSVATVDGKPGGVPTSGTLLSSTFTYYDAAGNAIESIAANGLRMGTIYNPDGSVEYTCSLNASRARWRTCQCVDLYRRRQ